MRRDSVEIPTKQSPFEVGIAPSNKRLLPCRMLCNREERSQRHIRDLMSLRGVDETRQRRNPDEAISSQFMKREIASSLLASRGAPRNDMGLFYFVIQVLPFGIQTVDQINLLLA
jgi:hypothetical protein